MAAILLFGLVPLACQRAPEGGETEPGATGGAGGAAVDTPTGAPADTPTAGGQDTGAEGEVAQEGAVGEASGDVVTGWKQYEANCSRCHGQDALGSAIAPDLRKSALSRDAFIQVVKDGRTEKGMPPFAELLDAQQMGAIHAYIVARSTGKLGPGRPGG